MGRPIYNDARWPRDFPERMYLGTLIHFLNKALHPDADKEDVALSRHFEDRPSASNPKRLESFHEQRVAHFRINGARAVALQAMRVGQLDVVWLDREGTFQPVDPQTFQQGATSEDLDAILTRFSLPGHRIPEDEVTAFGPAPSLYVSAHNAAALVQYTNPALPLPLAPSRTLEREGATAPAFDTIWSLSAATVWISTREIIVARGAHRYLAQMATRGYLPPEGALKNLAHEEIAYHYCRCHRPVCQCWDDALRDIVSRARVGELVGQGFKNDAGNQHTVPSGAWTGTINFGAGSSLEPAKVGGDRWTDIQFLAADIVRLFPPTSRQCGVAVEFCQTVIAGKGALENDAVTRSEAILRLAAQLDIEGIGIRAVKTAVIAQRWSPEHGTPPKVESVTREMKGGGRGGRPGKTVGRKLSDD